MLNNKFILLALIGASSLAAAAHSEPLPAAAVAAPASTSSDPSVAGVNPYTGNSLTIEQLSRELDVAKAQTAILEERVKQTALSADLDIVPAKKKAEAALYLKGGAHYAQADAPLAVTEAAKPVKVVAAPVVAIAAPAPAPVQIRITSVIGSGMSATVLLEANGQSIVAHNGDTTPYGVVRFENESTLSVGNQKLYLPSKTLARMTVSDPAPVDKDSVGTSPTLFTTSSNTSSRAALPPPIPAPPAASSKY
jgi:hypothetical protein